MSTILNSKAIYVWNPSSIVDYIHLLETGSPSYKEIIYAHTDKYISILIHKYNNNEFDLFYDEGRICYLAIRLYGCIPSADMSERTCCTCYSKEVCHIERLDKFNAVLSTHDGEISIIGICKGCWDMIQGLNLKQLVQNKLYAIDNSDEVYSVPTEYDFGYFVIDMAYYDYDCVMDDTINHFFYRQTLPVEFFNYKSFLHGKMKSSENTCTSCSRAIKDTSCDECMAYSLIIFIDIHWRKFHLLTQTNLTFELICEICISWLQI